MFFNRLFREQALARRQRQEPLDDRLQITAPHEWLLVAGLGVVILALLVYGVVGSVERGLSYDVVFVLPGERHPVTAAVSGIVVEVLAEVGDTVEPGQVIARVQTPADQQRESSALRLAELLREAEGQTEGPSAEILQLLLSVANAEAGSGLAAGGDVVSLTGGEVMALDLVTGRPVAAGETVALVRTAVPGPPEALALASPDEASRLEAGMEARVSVAAVNREASVLPAEVVAVSERPVTPPEWLGDLGLSASAGSHLVRVSVANVGTEQAVTDGSTGSLRVVLGRSSFLSLLAPGDRY